MRMTSTLPSFGSDSDIATARKSPSAAPEHCAVQDGKVLPGEDKRSRTVPAFQSHLPGQSGLVGVAGPDDRQTGHGPQRGQMLHRLMGRAVLPEPMLS